MLRRSVPRRARFTGLVYRAPAAIVTIVMVVLGLGVATATGRMALPEHSAPDGEGADDPIAALNRAIQDRFKDVDKTFGLRRIVVLDDTPHRFQPEKVSELAAVRELDEASLRVAFYMAGRRVLDREPDLTTKQPFALNRRVLFGPVAVTDPAALTGLPDAVDLITESRNAFRALERRDRYDFEMTDWTFTARAVRATAAECLTCHKDRKIGEPLGVVLYAYRAPD